MSEFENELDKRVSELQEQLAQARREDNEHLVESLVGQLEGIVDLADANDVDTGEMKRVLATETGQIPIIEDPNDS
ncbi:MULTISPECIES: hypothetical protein [Brevibacterium]|uniref:Uncharacterized protein n=1 Tax=Brevibacterium luteolum TaxID=199591 RepID=A0A2N6PLA8_9MICO|nr:MULTISPECIES: hypothetical protein [Brevibacterium]MBU8577277.1 hypothetical protein [Brevibacterium luteolum]MCT1656560.1 hypothetical protein [Brevibacterium luteolum]MCT1828989.1 hypothetical protein [Brevibacterium luteolum]MCT1873027.1 hypothetical protein [Brevibacterium luteolum]MCT1890483.1 hypothetical protein [Brevibacterium luteolum]